jgi:hypothetical protein
LGPQIPSYTEQEELTESEKSILQILPHNTLQTIPQSTPQTPTQIPSQENAEEDDSWRHKFPYRPPKKYKTEEERRLAKNKRTAEYRKRLREERAKQKQLKQLVEQRVRAHVEREISRGNICLIGEGEEDLREAEREDEEREWNEEQ